MNRIFPIIAGLCLLAITLWLELTDFRPIVHVIDRLESLAYDLQIQTRRLAHASPTDTPVVIVDIDDKSIAKEGRWPWPRAKLATLINQLKSAGAAVVAFDVIFPESESNPANTVLDLLKNRRLLTPGTDQALKQAMPLLDNDAQFASGLASMDTILGISFLPRNTTEGFLPPSLLALPASEQLTGVPTLPGYLANIAVLQKAAKSAGFINMFPDDDGIVRRTPLLIRYGTELYPSLALEAVRVYLLSQLKLKIANYYNESRLEGIWLGNHLIPTDDKAEVMIPFQGGSFYFPYYPASDVIHGQIPAENFTGKIVFVGTSATSLADLRATAVQSIYPGVEIHATVAYGILNNAFSSRPSWALGAEVTLTMLSGLLCIFLFPMVGPRLLASLIVIIPATFFLLNNLLWKQTGTLLSFFIPASFAFLLGVINLLYGYFFETRTREKLRAMFGQYVPETHITEMLSRPEQYTLYGEDREMTVLFADIRDFTHISEGLTADQLKEMLNLFLTLMTEVIFRHGGTIDKYIGDMIMAFWGAPLKDPAHAEHALQAALEMQEALQAFNDSRQDKWPEIKIGIGLNSGIMSVGDMGSQYRRNYTVIGDAVNLGSRAEGLTKFYGVNIIATSHTIANQNAFVFRHLDRVKVKGKETSIDIHEPLCLASLLTDSLRIELDHYHAALELYFSGKWEAAHAEFKILCEKHPHTRLYHLYLQRTENYLETPPPDNWNGVYVHTSK